MEYKLCEKLHKTPMEIGDLRTKDPLGISFIEQAIIHEYKEKEKQYKEAQKKMKRKR